ncbi:HORMA domain-containing protein 1 [Lethenteron reissneri]|uniref:HORMA domain-containing protein 1 n=1 Tax=Lethenteron reissneri TaxID=7753 RepID=UPI002AB7C177|nr:HORMA domain-containing protein 1 [Lethenteron reissneri]
MATAQMIRPKQSQRMSIIPEKIDTVQQSVVFIKRLIAIAISNITYLRGILPEKAYTTCYIDDLTLKIICGKTSLPGACQIVEWMKGCYDALEKNYLRMMVIAVYRDPQDPSTIFETYTFKFAYTALGPTMNFCSSKKNITFSIEETKRATILLIRKLFVLTQHLEEMPADVSLTMKLFYYDEVTPEDYQPPGFRASSTEPLHFHGDPTTLRVGHVASAFHSVKLRITVDRSQLDDYNPEEETGKTVVGKKRGDKDLLQQRCMEEEDSDIMQVVPELKTPELRKLTSGVSFDRPQKQGSMEAGPRNAVHDLDGGSEENRHEDNPLVSKAAALSLGHDSKSRSGLSLSNRKKSHKTDTTTTAMKNPTLTMPDKTILEEIGESNQGGVRRNPARAAKKRECFQLENGYTFNVSCSQDEEPRSKLSRNSEPDKRFRRSCFD